MRSVKNLLRPSVYRSMGKERSLDKRPAALTEKDDLLTRKHDI